MKNIETELQASVDKFWNVMDERFQGRVMTGRAVITQVTRDGAGRVSGAMAIVDGALAQRVVFDYGAPVALGDTYMAANDGGVSNPVWRLVRRLQTTSATPPLDTVPTLPTPTGLTLTKGLYAPDLGQEVKAWISAHWLTLPHRYGKLTYEVECVLTTDISADAIIARVLDSWPTSILATAISSTETTIPHTMAPHVVYNRFSLGRIQIKQEKIDYTAVTSDTLGPVEYGTGTGSANAFYDSSASWDDDVWKNFALIDSAEDIFRITANDSNTLTVIGTPASGSYYIYAAFCDCTRGAGGTDAMAYDAMQDLVGRSCGILFAGLRANTDYSLRVRATNEAGAISAWSARVSITTDPDLTIPPTPTGFTVESADAGVVLLWTAPTINTTPDLAGFYVYRAPDSTNPIKEVGLRNETFVEAELGVEHLYGLKAYDLSMNVSPMTAWVAGTALPATIVQPGQLLFTRTAELSEKLLITSGGVQSTSPAVPSYTTDTTEIYAGQSVTFTNISTGATQYLWEFGDGTTSATTSPVHVYTRAGIYRVRLTCYSGWGKQHIVGKTPITVNRDSGAIPPRVATGLQYLALFDKGRGLVVYDQSDVGLAYDMTIIGGDVVWGDDELYVDEGSYIKSDAVFSKVISACMASNEITLEAWVKRSGDEHYLYFTGCIMANSDEEVGEGNFMLLQTGNQQYEVRLRTSATNLAGLPSLAGGEANLTEVQQITFTRDSSGNAKLYIDATLVASMTLGGDFSTWWTNSPFAMADRVSGNLPWLGTLGLVAVYDSALSQANVETNLMAGRGEVGPLPVPPVAAFSFTNMPGDAPLTVDITESSTGEIDGFEWDFGDGTNSSVQDPGTHEYVEPGVYTPSLTVWNTGGSDVETKDAYVTVTDGGETPAGESLYVSPAGDDQDGSGSITNPWRTIQKGVDTMGRGDILYLRGVGDGGHGEGVYHETVELNELQGAANAWYTIRNRPGESPVVDGKYSLPRPGGKTVYRCPEGDAVMHRGGLVTVKKCHYLRWEGVEIKHSAGRGFDAATGDDNGGKYLTLKNCKVHSCRASTTKFVGWDNITIQSVTTYDSMNYCRRRRPTVKKGGYSPWAGAMTITGGKDHYVNNTMVFDSYGEGIHPFGWLRGEISDCVVFDCMNGMLPTTTCDGTVIQRNFVYSTRYYPFDDAAMLNVTMEAGAGRWRRRYSQNCKWINNIVVDGYICNRFMDRLTADENEYQWGFYKNSLLAHNTLVQHHNYIRPTWSLIRWLKQHHVDCIKLIDISNNVFWFDGAAENIVQTRQGNPDYNHNCWSVEPASATAKGTGDVYQNPRLQDHDTTGARKLFTGAECIAGNLTINDVREQAKRFRLTDGSPALGVGKDLSAEVPKDFWDNPRSSSPDMGAHEL